MNIRITIARAIKAERASERAGYLFDEEGDDFTAGSRSGYHSGVMDTLKSLAAATKPQQHNQHIKFYRHWCRVFGDEQHMLAIERGD